MYTYGATRLILGNADCSLFEVLVMMAADVWCDHGSGHALVFCLVTHIVGIIIGRPNVLLVFNVFQSHMFQDGTTRMPYTHVYCSLFSTGSDIGS